MMHINFPPFLVCTWEGTATMKDAAEYNFKLRSFAGTSQLIVDDQPAVMARFPKFGDGYSMSWCEGG